jgi:hypothetical protein
MPAFRIYSTPYRPYRYLKVHTGTITQKKSPKSMSRSEYITYYTSPETTASSVNKTHKNHPVQLVLLRRTIHPVVTLFAKEYAALWLYQFFYITWNNSQFCQDPQKSPGTASSVKTHNAASSYKICWLSYGAAGSARSSNASIHSNTSQHDTKSSSLHIHSSSKGFPSKSPSTNGNANLAGILAN